MDKIKNIFSHALTIKNLKYCKASKNLISLIDLLLIQLKTFSNDLQ